jgi:hypothetical protein
MLEIFALLILGDILSVSHGGLEACIGVGTGIGEVNGAIEALLPRNKLRKPSSQGVTRPGARAGVGGLPQADH